MILYVNGDSHTAAAEAVNSFAFAEDDKRFFYLGRAPHPDNLVASWGQHLARTIKASFFCGAESASSNARIIRTTKEWLDQQTTYNDLLVVIQWSTWEREEWLHDGIYYQVNASGLDHVPQSLQEKYRNYIIGIDWLHKTNEAHQNIWAFHQELLARNVKHVFFNGNNDFSLVTDRKDWGKNYLDPYLPSMTFASIVKSGGFDTVAPNSWHFGKEAHSFFHRFVLQYIITNNFI